MSDIIEQYKETGILEAYVLGLATPGEIREVEEVCARYPELKDEIGRLQNTMEKYGQSLAVEPPPLVKTYVMAAVEYMDRSKNHPPQNTPPLLTESSRVEDFQPWLDQEGMPGPEELKDVCARVLAVADGVTTSVVWAKSSIGSETHQRERESFLIVEGSCEVLMGQQVYNLQAGDFLEVPMYMEHSARVTSNSPCKIIVQHISV